MKLAGRKEKRSREKECMKMTGWKRDGKGRKEGHKEGWREGMYEENLQV